MKPEKRISGVTIESVRPRNNNNAVLGWKVKIKELAKNGTIKRITTIPISFN